MFFIPVKQLYSTHKNKNNDLTYSLSKLEIQHTEYGGLSLDNNGKITQHIMGKSNSDNQIIDAGLTVWLEPVGDRSKLRNLRGINFKPDKT